MTLPSERTRAILATDRFLVDLLSARTTPRVPRAIRARAKELLRHYPTAPDLRHAGLACPEVFDAQVAERFLVLR